MTPRFYAIHAFDSRKYPRAETFGPLPEMPFFEGMEEFLERKLAYWKINPTPAGMTLAAEGSEWSDLIYCSFPGYFVSQRIIDDLESEGIPILRKTVMPIAQIKSKRLRELQPPTYYVVEAIPGLAVNWRAMGIPLDGNERPSQHMNLPPIVFDESSWNGLDLFSLTNRGSTISHYCTERVKQLAEREKWTNIEFVSIGATGDT